MLTPKNKTAAMDVGMGPDTTRVAWLQSVPGKGINVVQVTRMGTVVAHRADGSLWIRPDDAPGTLMLTTGRHAKRVAKSAILGRRSVGG